MKTILICNQKGGVWKTTIADELAFSFDRTNTPYSLYDMDGQGGLLHEPAEREDAEVAITDTPGALQQDLKSWIDMADVIIIPTLPSSRDLVPLQTMLELVKGTSKQVYVVLNEYGGTYVASRAFNDWLETECTYPVLALPRSEVVIQAAMAQKSVVDYAPKHGSVIAIKRLTDTIRRAVGIKAEE